MSCSARESALDGGAVRNRSSGGSWYGPNGVLTVRERDPLAAGSGGSDGNSGSSATAGMVSVEASCSSSTSGSWTTSSVSPNASRSDQRRRGFSRSASFAFAETGSRSSRSSRNVAIFSFTAANGVPVKISSPRLASPAHTIAAPIGEITRASGQAASAPIAPPASASTPSAVQPSVMRGSR